MRVLIAGVGNVLRADDAFGVEVGRRLDTLELPEGVKVVETGIGGIALVQELQGGYDALIVIDAVDRERPPGTVMLIEPEVVDVHELSWSDKHDLLADVHLATPERAMMLSKALGVLPEKLLMVGCQPLDANTPGLPMSEPVRLAVDVAVTEILAYLRTLLGEPTPTPAAAVPEGD